MAYDLKVWKTIKNESFAPTIEIENDILLDKMEVLWKFVESKEVQ